MAAAAQWYCFCFSSGLVLNGRPHAAVFTCCPCSLGKWQGPALTLSRNLYRHFRRNLPIFCFSRKYPAPSVQKWTTAILTDGSSRAALNRLVHFVACRSMPANTVFEPSTTVVPFSTFSMVCTYLFLEVQQVKRFWCATCIYRMRTNLVKTMTLR